MPEAITVSKETLETLLICSVRYALGRRTHIVHDVCALLQQYAPLLDSVQRAIIVRDIREQARFGYGDDCDRRDWMAALALLGDEEEKTGCAP